jgi:predicted permease
LIEPRLVNEVARAQLSGYFTSEQSVNFPLLFLLVELILTFFTVFVYRMLLTQLPSNWISRGLLVGFFLFLVSDFPYSVIIGYATVAPAVAAWGMLYTGLISKLINGCILTYSYNRFSSDYQKNKNATLAASVKGPRT